MANLSMCATDLMGTALSLATWGIYVCLFGVTIWVMRLRRVSLLSPPVILISVIFLLNIGDTACICFATYKALRVYPDGAKAYMILWRAKEIDRWWAAFDNFCLLFSAVVNDILMTWRLYIVWSRDRRIIYFPLLLLCFGGVGALTIVVDDLLTSTHYTDATFDAQVFGMDVALFGGTFVLTWYLTGMICFRLCSMDRQKRRVAQSSEDDGGIGGLNSQGQWTGQYGRVMRVLIQSGMLYTLTEVACLITFVMKNQTGQALIQYLNIRVVGICSTAVILQLNMSVSNLSSDNSNEQRETNGSIPVFRVPS
ncbi:hypothetical protein FRB94_005071 [Tulasnella sp. JGI-2019a]|nr:hypothetical protein FRB93_006348 [Tulasnella sp. JGI-2019a]KAG9000955.1 hypothetical protein FRB94_005071 [Tulasnella sp. JGI-2019a]